MKPLPAYVLVVVAFLLPIGFNFATYDERGLPSSGMLFVALIAYAILIFVAIRALRALYKTFVGQDNGQYNRLELSARLVLVIGLMVTPLFTGEPTYGWNEADFAKTISVELNGKNYTVPVKYLDSYWKEKGKIVSVSLIALLPNMEPKTMSNKEEFTSETDGFGRRIRITFRKFKTPDSSFTEKYGDLSNKANNLRYMLDFFTNSGLIQPLERKFGLNYYERPGFSFKTEMYVADDQSSGVYFECDEDRKDFYPSCHTSIPYKDNVVLQYTFRKTFLKDWEIIQSQVLDLVGGLEATTLR